MKKFKHIYFLVVTCVACQGTDSSKYNGDELLTPDEQTTASKPELKGDFTIHEHDLSMYGEKYFMRIAPTVDSVNNKYQSNIVLTKKSDTIFNKKINIDSLEETIIKYEVYADSAEHDKIASDYELRKVVYHGVRAKNLYFQAEIASTEGKNDLKVLFQLTYLGKDEIGKLFVNGFSEKGWGDNAGEIIDENNKKITPP
ncbi:MAG: hypothetical protein R3345_09740 [Fulvivirga sp.]|nr:hypothetical protein [Fulvivirga sp.]